MEHRNTQAFPRRKIHRNSSTTTQHLVRSDLRIPQLLCTTDRHQSDSVSESVRSKSAACSDSLGRCLSPLGCVPSRSRFKPRGEARSRPSRAIDVPSTPAAQRASCPAVLCAAIDARVRAAAATDGALHMAHRWSYSCGARCYRGAACLAAFVLVTHKQHDMQVNPLDTMLAHNAVKWTAASLLRHTKSTPLGQCSCVCAAALAQPQTQGRRGMAVPTA